MNSLPPNDPFVTLWQTAPPPDTQQMMQNLQRLNRLHERLNLVVMAILGGVSLLLIFGEATGRMTTQGRLSVIWILCLVTGVVWRRRSQCSRSDALTLDSVHLLERMIAKAKSDLFVARCLYAGVPLGALAGLVAARLAGISVSPSVHPRLHLIQTAAGVAALLIMMAAGAILARSRHVQVQELSEKLRLIKSDL
jgi:hypothetical protein